MLPHAVNVLLLTRCRQKLMYKEAVFFKPFSYNSYVITKILGKSLIQEMTIKK